MNNTIKGKFTKIIWKNATNTFFLINFRISSNQDDKKQQLNILSTQNNISVFIDNNSFEFKVNYEIELDVQKSEKYDYKYTVKRFNILSKDDNESAILFLSSKLFFGISEKTAKKVIDKFGLDIINNPTKYKNELIQLIGINRANSIIEGINNENEFQNIYKKFIDNSLSIALLNTICELIPKSKLNELFSSDKLFSIIEIIEVVDFFDLVNIAKIFNTNFNDEIRNKHLIIWIMKMLESNGSSIITITSVFNTFNKYYLINRNSFVKYIKELILENTVLPLENNQSICLVSTFEKEKYIVERLNKLNKVKNNIEIKKDIIKDNLDEIQTQALINALNNNVSIITGSPGTGKTVIFSILIKNLENNKIKNIESLAPTGKAATQISIKSNKETKTIHSFLKWNKIDYDVNELFPSEAEVVIIDEFSMVDVNLFCAILKATPNLKKIILIGDKDQLPSIKCGYLLNDFISSNKFNVTHLKKIYRQKEGSAIIKNALEINNGLVPSFISENTKLINANDESDAYNKVEEFMRNYLKTNSISNQQILIPMYKGIAGIDNINLLVQKEINKNNTILFQTKNNVYYKNDKVIQLENDVERNVFNGEIGYIESVMYAKEKNEIEKIFVVFDRKIISYTLSEFNQSTKLAYAISIHKFQGSECKDVLIVLTNSQKSMISKKLLYTAYTRASETITIISNKEILTYAVSNDFDSQRKCNILNLLKK